MRFIGIDPSGKTGLVVLNDDGVVLLDTEIVSEHENESMRIALIAKKVMELVRPIAKFNTFTCIEGFSYGSKGRSVGFQFGLGHMLRINLLKDGFSYYEPSPSQVKKFASGNHQLKKNLMVKEVFKRWGFDTDSDNIADAYVLAQIARYKHLQLDMTKFQREVIDKLGA